MCLGQNFGRGPCHCHRWSVHATRCCRLSHEESTRSVGRRATQTCARSSILSNIRLDRLMEKQYGLRVPIDDRAQKQRSASISTNHRAFNDGNDQMKRDPASTESAGRESHSGRGADAAELQRLQETISHQKYEIVRLLNAVKTLSTENTTLLKVSCID